MVYDIDSSLSGWILATEKSRDVNNIIESMYLNVNSNKKILGLEVFKGI